jgi:hypothetical protein
LRRLRAECPTEIQIDGCQVGQWRSGKLVGVEAQHWNEAYKRGGEQTSAVLPAEGRYSSKPSVEGQQCARGSAIFCLHLPCTGKLMNFAEHACCALP